MNKESFEKLKGKLGKPAIVKMVYAYVIKVISRVMA
jgi:hypothetical protein